MMWLIQISLSLSPVSFAKIGSDSFWGRKQKKSVFSHRTMGSQFAYSPESSRVKMTVRNRNCVNVTRRSHLIITKLNTLRSYVGTNCQQHISYHLQLPACWFLAHPVFLLCLYSALQKQEPINYSSLWNQISPCHC